MARPANAVTSNSSPPTIARTGDNSVYQSSYQNPGFYAQGRYWVFYEDSSSTCEHQTGCLFYVWSVNGATLWSTPVNVGVHVADNDWSIVTRSEEHTSELQSHSDLVCRLLLEKKNP